MTSDPMAWRAARQWIALTGRIRPADERRSGVRFGITAGKRQARLAVERNAVRRVLREAVRCVAARLDAIAGPRSVEVVLRLKAPLPSSAGAKQAKRLIRLEADRLLAQLATELERRAAAAAAAGPA